MPLRAEHEFLETLEEWAEAGAPGPMDAAAVAGLCTQLDSLVVCPGQTRDDYLDLIGVGALDPLAKSSDLRFAQTDYGGTDLAGAPYKETLRSKRCLLLLDRPAERGRGRPRVRCTHCRQVGSRLGRLATKAAGFKGSVEIFRFLAVMSWFMVLIIESLSATLCSSVAFSSWADRSSALAVSTSVAALAAAIGPKAPVYGRTEASEGAGVEVRPISCSP